MGARATVERPERRFGGRWTLTDNDTPSTRVTLTLNPSQVSEGAGSATVTVTGRLDEAARPSPTSVTVSVAGGTATAGTRTSRRSTSFPLTIPAKAPRVGHPDLQS